MFVQHIYCKDGVNIEESCQFGWYFAIRLIIIRSFAE